MRPSTVLLPALLAFSCFAQVQAPVVGQQAGSPITRSVEGAVTDIGGSPAPNAVVLLKDTKTLQVRSFIAQKDGHYHFYGLSTDISYQVRAEANGMTSPIKTLSVFDSHQKVLLNLKLKKKMKKS